MKLKQLKFVTSVCKQLLPHCHLRMNILTKIDWWLQRSWMAWRLTCGWGEYRIICRL